MIELGRLAIPRRPALVGLALLTVVTGTFAMVRAAEKVWAADAIRNLDAARALLDGSFGTVPDYLYSPLAAALTIPVLALPTDLAVLGWLAIKVLLVLVGAAVATRGIDRLERALLVVAAMGFLPLLYDLELGNVTVLVLGAVALGAWAPDRLAAGIPLGLILATAPKPQLLPILAWMLLARRWSLAGALISGAIATVAGVAIAGVDHYETWLAVLRAPAYLNAGEVINLALWGLPAPIAVPAAGFTLVAFLLALRRGFWPGLTAAICAGMLLAPYTLVYAAALLLAVAPVAARASPSATFALALLAPPLLILAFPLWVGLVLVLSVLVPREAWPAPPEAVRLAHADAVRP